MKDYLGGMWQKVAVNYFTVLKTSLDKQEITLDKWKKQCFKDI
jgi:hypothetical protein